MSSYCTSKYYITFVENSQAVWGHTIRGRAVAAEVELSEILLLCQVLVGTITSIQHSWARTGDGGGGGGRWRCRGGRWRCRGRSRGRGRGCDRGRDRGSGSGRGVRNASCRGGGGSGQAPRPASASVDVVQTLVQLPHLADYRRITWPDVV